MRSTEGGGLVVIHDERIDELSNREGRIKDLTFDLDSLKIVKRIISNADIGLIKKITWYERGFGVNLYWMP